MSYVPSEASRRDDDGNEIPWIPMECVENPISPELAMAIAGVVVEWSAFESMIVTDTSNLMLYSIVRKLADSRPRSFKQKIELWKRAVHALYPTVRCYLEAADEICSKGKAISHYRHLLIHGHWLPPQGDGSQYEVLMVEGLDTVEKLSHVTATVSHVINVRNDIKTVSDALFGFMCNRMWHAGLGLLTGVPVPKP